MTAFTACKAVAYLRVSTEGQIDKYGFAAQETAVRDYADKNDIQLVKIFKEKGLSGTHDLDDRIALVELVDFLDEAEDITLCIIPEFSRLARKLMVQEKILDDFKRKGWSVVSVKEPDLCKDDPERVLMRSIMGAINEYDRKMIISRLKAGRIAKTRKGEHATGRLPMGYDSVLKDGKKKMVKVESEIEIVKLIKQLREVKLLSYQKIADYLNNQGYKPKNWTPETQVKFYGSTISGIYNNPKYMGNFELKEHGKTIATGYSDELNIY